MPESSVRRGDRLSVLLLCDDRPSHAPNVLEHLGALQRYSRHRLDVSNPRGLSSSRLLRFEHYDVVILHYSIFALSDIALPPWFREQLAAFSGLKVQFVQDEYRSVDAMTERMRELGIDLLFSSVPPDALALVYGTRIPGVDVVPTLTGFVPARLQELPRQPLAGRPLDVVYRGRSIPYWLGRLGQEKVLIGREFMARAALTDLRCDISWTETDRIYGEAWYRFLGSSRTTLGTESGASIVDFDGALQERTESYLRSKPTATFDEVQREILSPFEGNAVIQTLSPRVFEAAAVGTGMVNFTGRYSDVIEPWTHYIPLEKDFSNFDQVAAAIREDELLDTMAARAHEDLVRSGRYSLQAFVQGLEREIEARVKPVPHRPRPRIGSKVTRSLLPLERLRSREQRAELPLAISLRTRTIDRARQRLIQRFPAVEALALRAELEGPRDQSDRVLHDLVRLAAAAAAHTRELRYLGPPFDVRVELDDHERRVILVSTPRPSQGAAERLQLRHRVEPAIREGRLDEIVWNHRAVGVYLKFLSVPTASLDIGYHIVNGAHRFSALADLARRDPEGVIAALEPLFQPRPADPAHELPGRLVSLVRVASSPGAVASRGAAALRAVLMSKELRVLLGAYLRNADARSEASIDRVLEDFFALSLVGQAAVQMELDAARRILVYRTSPPDVRDGVKLDAKTVQSLEQIVWDNSALGPSVTSKNRPRVSVTFQAGVHEFQALTLVARRFPALAAPALLRAAASE